MKLKPLNDRIIVERCEPEKITKGGIHLPERSLDRPMMGIVLAVGPGRIREGNDEDHDGHYPMSLIVGNKVVFYRNSGSEIDIDGSKVVVMSETDVLAIVEGE